MSYDSEVLADSPLAYWKLDETSGTTAADSSGNSRPLTINGSVTLGAAAVMPSGSSSFDFPAATSAYLIANAAAWMAASSFTVEAWIRADVVSSYHCIASRESNSTSNRHWSAYITSGLVNMFTGSDRFGTATLSAATVYHIVITFDSATSTLKYYINGSLDKTYTPTSVPNSQTVTPYDFYVGVSHAATGSLNFPFDGRMSHIAYFGSALSATRVAAHYSAGTNLGSSGSGSISLSASGSAAVTGAGSGSLSLAGSGAGSAPAAGTGSLSLSGTGAIDFQPVAGTGSLTLSGSGGAGVGTAGTGSITLTGTGAATGAQAASGTGTLTLTGAGSATLAAAGTGTLTLSAIGEAQPLYSTDTTNARHGRRRSARATVTITRPVAAPPASLVLATKVDKALAYPVPTMVDGRPT